MDKRKYEDALKRAKELLDDMDKGDYFASKADIENIFPELKEKETEDERIRKAIIAYINHGQHNGVSNKDMIAWLEKQSENKKLDADKVTAWLVANICDFEYYVNLFKKDFGL